MKKRGFTLIELISVIAILSIILVISVPSLLNSIKKNKEDASKTIEGLVISAGRNYVIDHGLSYPTNIPINALCNGYIECPIIDVNGNEVKGFVSVDSENKYSLVIN